MDLWTSLEPASTTVDPGSSTTVRLRLRNTGDVVDEYRFEPVGGIAPWMTVEPQTVRLYPGTTATVELTIAPPRTPDATAGANPYAVRITPTEHPEATTVPEGNVTITPFTELRAELVPPTVKGRFRARPKLAVDNLGNTKLTASVSGSDNGDSLSYDIRPGSIQVEPGRAVFVDATLKPRQITWFGSKEQRPYTLAVQRSGAQPVDVDGTYVQRGFLPGWLATALGIALALAITFVVIWLAYKPQVRSLATEKVADSPVSALPPSASPPAQPSAQAESKAPTPDPTPEKEDSGAGATEEPPAGGGGAETEQPPAPAPGSHIISKSAGLCIEATGQVNGEARDGTHLTVWNCKERANQKWEFLGDGTVRSLGMCMDVAWGAKEDGTVIQLARCTGVPAQKFVLSGEGDLVNPQANKCVDAKDGGRADGDVLRLWTCAGVPHQKWRTEG
ncbi:ricin-type beta-trefoil lectin domain protein [Streptomyces sp. NPDC048438]|uniref:ricin-type beta-trefoil lectin domain protein n=1 Tax=Streptomyces sp. NPDC048438 TaxID=3365551 RepID=UPI00371703BB